MLVVNRFRAPDGTDGTDLRTDLEAVLALLGTRAGFVDGTLARNLDDPALWVLATRWEHVGAYRRALSSYEVKLHGVPVLSRALDEPSAYEIVEPDSVLNVAATRVT